MRTPSPDRERQAGKVAQLLRVLLAPFVALVVVLDEIVRPLLQPLLRRFAALRLVARTEAAIARMPPYAVLALLAVPFAVAEPLKILALVVMAHGGLASGLVLLAVAYLASFLVVERIYHAGHAALMTIGWFAAIMGFVVRVREAVLGWLRATPLWRRMAGFGAGLRETVRRQARVVLDRLRALFG